MMQIIGFSLLEQAYNKGPNMYTTHKANEAHYKRPTVSLIDANYMKFHYGQQKFYIKFIQITSHKLITNAEKYLIYFKLFQVNNINH